MPATRSRKVRINLSIDARLLEWVKANTGPGKRFGTMTHAFESGIVELQRQGT